MTRNRSPAAAAMHRTGRGDGQASHRDEGTAFVAGQLDLYRKNTKRTKSGNSSSSSVTLRSFFAPKVTSNVDGGAGKRRRVVGSGGAGSDEEETATSSLPALADRSGSTSSPRHAAESRGKATTETARPGAADEESRTLPYSSALHDALTGTARVQSSSSSRPRAAPPGDEHGGKRRRTRQMQQLYLDFGQSNFAKQIICTKCGMLYVHGLAEDAASHESICRDYRQGVSVGKWKKARVVKRFADASRGGERIVEVRPSDAIAYRQTVAKVKSIVDQEMGFVPHSTRDDDDDCVPPQTQHTQRTAFLYVSSKNKIIGFCTTQLITRAYHLQRPSAPNPPTPTVGAKGVASTDATTSIPDLDRAHPRQSLSLTRSQVPTGATLGVHQIWTHSDHRGRGIATALLDAARANVVFGSRVPIDMVAFSSPTGDGVELARRYVCGRDGVLEDVKVYDC